MYIDQVTANTTDAAANSGSQQQGGNNNVDTNKKLVAISFDDGTGVAGQRITDALAANGFHATFFYVGNWINNENQVRYAYNKGMEIANHTTSHQDLTGMNAQQIRKEYDDTQYKLRNIIGTEPSKLMRLPYLSCNWQVQQTLNDVPLISCSVDSEDWKGISSDQIVANIQNAARNGSLEGAIVLCHENQANTATAMETVLPWLKDNGYEVVTISDMFAAKGQTLQGGQVYTKVS
ncbi:MAG: polysaccharide deacetylase family protein [Ruminococcus sp.]|nr:polysaccharide deacetylase family protein [Ruminococcus sp.]